MPFEEEGRIFETGITSNFLVEYIELGDFLPEAFAFPAPAPVAAAAAVPLEGEDSSPLSFSLSFSSRSLNVICEYDR